MAKIIKVGSQNITPSKTLTPSRTSRKSTTNPFKYSNFEGNTLQFADVFEGFDTKNIKKSTFKGTADKMKLVSTSVVGSMNKIKSSIPESIVNFVNRVCDVIVFAWDYAKNTNVSDVPFIKSFNDLMNTKVNLGPIDKFADSVSGIGKSIPTKISEIRQTVSSKLGIHSTDLTDLGKSVSEKWSSLVALNSHKKISSDMPVGELETLLKNELEGLVA